MKATTLELIRFPAVEMTQAALEKLAAKIPPNGKLTPGQQVQIAPLGEWRTVDGRQGYSDLEDFQLVQGDLATRANPVSCNFNHEDDPKRGADAAGECSVFVGQANGFWGLDPHWTPEAVAAIGSGALTWISPEFYCTYDEQDRMRPRVLRAYALVPTPNIDGMKRVELSADKGKPSPQQASERKEQDMKLSTDTAKLLKLDPEKASQEDFDKAVQELAAKKQNCSACGHDGHPNGTCSADCGCATSKNSSATPANFAAEVAKAVETIRAEALAAATTIVESKFAAKDADTKALELVEQAAKDGKVVPANREHALALAKANPEAFKALIAQAPRVAPTVQVVTPSRDMPISTDTNERLTKVAQFAAQRGITMTQAEAHLAGAGVIA